MLPQVIIVATLCFGMGTAGVGMMQWFLELPPPLAYLLQGLVFVIVSLPMLMLSWYLWAINNIVREIQNSRGTPAQQLEAVKGTLGPILALLKMTEKASASAKMGV